MKKIVSFALILLLIGALFSPLLSVSVFAATDPAPSIALVPVTTHLVPGKTVGFSVELKNAPRLLSCRLKGIVALEEKDKTIPPEGIRYSDSFEWSSTSKTWLLEGGERTFSDADKTGSVVYSTKTRAEDVTANDYISASGEIFQFSLKLKNDVPLGKIEQVTVNFSVTLYWKKTIKEDGKEVDVYEIKEYPLQAWCRIRAVCQQHQFDDLEPAVKITQREPMSGIDYDKLCEPTCNQNGWGVVTCSVCGYQEKREIPAIGHLMGNWIVEEEPTCSNPGYRSQYCARGDHVVTEQIPPLGHRFGEARVIQEPTEETDGISERICEQCGEVLQESIPKLKSGEPLTDEKTEPSRPVPDGSEASDQNKMDSPKKEEASSFPVLPVAIGSGVILVILISAVIWIVKKKK